MVTAHGLAASHQADEYADAGWKHRGDLLNAMATYLAGRAELAPAKNLLERALALKQRGTALATPRSG